MDLRREDANMRVKSLETENQSLKANLAGKDLVSTEISGEYVAF